MDKIAFVIQRYGAEVNGGAEQECRMYAERLTGDYDVEVLTTCALDYDTWGDHYPAGTEVLNGVTVRRFPVKKERDPVHFPGLHEKILNGTPFTDRMERQWAAAQGPDVPRLLRYIRRHRKEYRALIFCTYLYYQTCLGVKIAPEKSVTVPTAHDEPFLRLHIYDDVFQKPAGIFYNTEEEQHFVEQRYHNTSVPSRVGGVGVELPEITGVEAFKAQYGLDRYMVYVGRVDASKGCQELIDYYERYKRTHDNGMKLVFVGKNMWTGLQMPDDPDIISLGFVDEETKYRAMAGARMLVLPSRFESLSMVVLESLALGVPVVLNGACEVLKAHCHKSNAGLYYANYREWEACVDRIDKDERLRAAMGENGIRYVQERYSWDGIIGKLKELIEQIPAGI